MKIFRRATNIRELCIHLILLVTVFVFLSFSLTGCIDINAPQLTLSPESGEPGTEVKVTGSGFSANTTVTISFERGQIGSSNTTDEGDFSTYIIIASNITGQKVITALVDGTALAEASFVLEPEGILPSSPPVPPSVPTSDWALRWPLIFVGAVCFVLTMMVILLALDRRRLTGYGDYRETQIELAQVTHELNKTKNKYQSYESLERQIPSLKQQYNQVAAEVRDHFPLQAETSFRDLLSAPETEYWALSAQLKAVKAIRAYFSAEIEKGRALRSECLALANQIKEDEPVLFDTLQRSIESASVGGLNSLKPVLEQMTQQVAKKEISPQVKNDLAQLEKSLQSVVDLSYRLIPSRLVKFAQDLIETPASEKENRLREKTVRQIINLINEYFRH